MGFQVSVRDNITGGGRGEPIQFTFPAREITVAQLLRERVVAELSRSRPGWFHELLQPKASVEELHAQVETAFQKRHFIVLTDSRQLESLDDICAPDSEVTFFRLVPLAGG